MFKKENYNEKRAFLKKCTLMENERSFFSVSVMMMMIYEAPSKRRGGQQFFNAEFTLLRLDDHEIVLTKP